MTGSFIFSRSFALSFLLFLCYLNNVIAENTNDTESSRILESTTDTTNDDCKITTSSSSICGLAYQTLMQNKYVAEACVSAYFYDIKDCQNSECVFNKLPREGCACRTTYDSLSLCLDYNNPTQMCRTVLRLWLNACIYPSTCITKVTNQIGKCSDGPNSSFTPCLNNAIYNATCNTDPARLFSGTIRDELNNIIVVILAAFFIFL
jgi:hypothetical protein